MTLICDEMGYKGLIAIYMRQFTISKKYYMMIVHCLTYA